MPAAIYFSYSIVSDAARCRSRHLKWSFFLQAPFFYGRHEIRTHDRRRGKMRFRLRRVTPLVSIVSRRGRGAAQREKSPRATCERSGVHPRVSDTHACARPRRRTRGRPRTYRSTATATRRDARLPSRLLRAYVRLIEPRSRRLRKSRNADAHTRSRHARRRRQCSDVAVRRLRDNAWQR